MNECAKKALDWMFLTCSTAVLILLGILPGFRYRSSKLEAFRAFLFIQVFLHKQVKVSRLHEALQGVKCMMSSGCLGATGTLREVQTQLEVFQPNSSCVRTTLTFIILANEADAHHLSHFMDRQGSLPSQNKPLTC